MSKILYLDGAAGRKSNRVALQMPDSDQEWSNLVAAASRSVGGNRALADRLTAMTGALTTAILVEAYQSGRPIAAPGLKSALLEIVAAGASAPAPSLPLTTSDSFDRLQRGEHGVLAGRLGESEAHTLSPLDRRTFLQRLATLAGPALVPGLFNLDVERMTHNGPAEPALLDGLARLTRSYVQLHNTVPPTVVREGISRHFDELVALALRPQSPSVSSRIRSLAAQTGILAGWVSFNLQSVGQALTYWIAAHDLAQEAGQLSVQAHALACRSRLYSSIHRGPQMGDSATALGLLHQATHLAEGSASPALRSWLLANRAQQLAATNQATASYRDLDAAAHLVSVADPTDEDVLAGWDEVRVAAYRGICALVVGRASEVIETTEEVLARTDETRVQRSLQQSDLAAAYAQQGETDHACALLIEALSSARRGQFPEGVQRAIGVRTEYLGNRGTFASVRQLDEAIGTANLC